MARGHIRQRSKKNKDSWTVYVYQGVDPVTGKKKYTTEVVHTGKRDAEKRLTELLRLHDTGEYVEPAKEKTAEFLEHWFKEYAETHVSPRTLEGYRGNLDRYIIPALGNIRLDKLTGRQIESFESDCQRKGLSSQTVLHCHRTIFQALRWGVRMRILVRNVAEEVEPPKHTRFQPQTLDWDKVGILLEAARSGSYFPLYLIALLTGLRRSELLALRWQDVDLKTGVVAVSRGLVQLHTGERLIGPPKSGKSRSVDLPEQAVNCFRMLSDSQKGRRPEDLVFCHSDGSELLPDTVTRAFGRLAAQVGLKGVRFHDLRHGHASLLLGEGVHLKVVSERLGHAGIGITGDLYSHVLPGLQREAAMKLSEKFDALAPIDLQKDLQIGHMDEMAT
jgi:integrase